MEHFAGGNCRARGYLAGRFAEHLAGGYLGGNLPSILPGGFTEHLARGIWGVVCRAFCRGVLPSILPGVFWGRFAEHLAGGNYALVLPSILPGGFAMLSAMQLAGGNPLSVNLTLPTAINKALLREPHQNAVSMRSFFSHVEGSVRKNYFNKALLIHPFFDSNCLIKALLSISSFQT